jgi:hypothetical protein
MNNAFWVFLNIPDCFAPKITNVWLQPGRFLQSELNVLQKPHNDDRIYNTTSDFFFLKPRRRNKLGSKNHFLLLVMLYTKHAQ